MIEAGAVWWEFLKYFTMMGIVMGQNFFLTLIDQDRIEGKLN